MHYLPDNEIEKEFDYYHSRFNSQGEQYCNLGPEGVSKLKSFILSQRHKDLLAIVEMVEGKKIGNLFDTEAIGDYAIKLSSKHPLLRNSDMAKSGYDIALSDIAEDIKKLQL